MFVKFVEVSVSCVRCFFVGVDIRGHSPTVLVLLAAVQQSGEAKVSTERHAPP